MRNGVTPLVYVAVACTGAERLSKFFCASPGWPARSWSVSTTSGATRTYTSTTRASQYASARLFVNGLFGSARTGEEARLPAFALSRAALIQYASAAGSGSSWISARYWAHGRSRGVAW